MTAEIPWHQQEYKKSLASSQRLIPVVGPLLAAQAEAKNALRDTEHIHPSEMASEKWCPRSTFYRITGVPESDPDKYDFRRLNIFEEGNLVGEKWQRWMYEAGILVGMWRCLVCDHYWWAKSPPTCPECTTTLIKYAEVPLSDPEHWIIGHADGLFEDEQGEALEETKTIGLGTVRYDAPALYDAHANGNITLDQLWDRIKRPLSAHNRQLQVYMHCTGVHKGVVIYEWKPTQHTREFNVTFEPAIVKPMLDKCDVIMQAVADETPPPRPPQATNKSCDWCQYCTFRSTCHKK